MPSTPAHERARAAWIRGAGRMTGRGILLRLFAALIALAAGIAAVILVILLVRSTLS